MEATRTNTRHLTTPKTKRTKATLKYCSKLLPPIFSIDLTMTELRVHLWLSENAGIKRFTFLTELFYCELDPCMSFHGTPEVEQTG